MTYIVECLNCGKPWQVDEPMVAGPGSFIEVPVHNMLNQPDSTATITPCSGQRFPGIGLGNRAEWESGWAQRHPTRPRPAVADGAGVKWHRA
jgi:hypothetical protein